MGAAGHPADRFRREGELMNARQLKEALVGVPDDMEVVVLDRDGRPSDVQEEAMTTPKTHTKMKAGRLVAVYVEDGQGRRLVLAEEDKHDEDASPDASPDSPEFEAPGLEEFRSRGFTRQNRGQNPGT